jgi:hypothetical protein
MLGSVLTPRSHHGCEGPGLLLGAAIYGAISMDQRSPRSHPNKAADVVFAKLLG